MLIGLNVVIIDLTALNSISMSNGGFVIMPTDPELEDDQVIHVHTVFEEQKV